VRRGPGELEGEVLTTLWSASSPMTAAELQAELPGHLADTTVMTILTRLIRKGLAVRSRDDGARVYRYAPSMDRAEHAAEQMLAFLSPGEDHHAILARFLGRLGASDRRALADLLRRRTP
jgi:predicted transcriptional regulator